MRSLFKTLTITAFALTGLAGFAQAAPHDGMHPGRQNRVGDQPSYDDVTPAMPVDRPAPRMMQPRLAALLHEVRVAEHRIDVDRRDGRLPVVTARRLDGQAEGIRLGALVSARAHGGRLPVATFAALQHDMMRLDRAIGRMA